MKIKTIMMVDDNEADQFLTRCVIEEFDPDIEIHEAHDGEDALKKLEELKEQPCLILLDINMPTMNGFEFLEEYNKTADISIVVAMLTSSDQERDKASAAKYPCVKDFIVKPLSVDDLKRLAISKGGDAA